MPRLTVNIFLCLRSNSLIGVQLEYELKISGLSLFVFFFMHKKLRSACQLALSTSSA